MRRSITTDAINKVIRDAARAIDERLEEETMTKELVWKFYEGKTTQHIRHTMAYAPEGGTFATLLQAMLDDREDWDGEQ